MTAFVILAIWFIGAGISARIYYHRRCGVWPASGEVGVTSAVWASMLWPITWFVDGWRNPKPCRHRQHLEYHPPPPAQMPPSPKQNESSSPEHQGFSEGDRVRLVKPFWGEIDPSTGVLMKDWAGQDKGSEPLYAAGAKGTIIYPDDADPRTMRAEGKHLVAMDDGRRLYSADPFPGVEGTPLERIAGRYQVAHHDKKVYLRPKFDTGDRVALKETFTSRQSGMLFEAGWTGMICPLTVTMAECWASGNYPVSLDPDPFGAERGMVNVPAEALELIEDRRDR
ncbi:hypothetical protein [Nonomuraea sp. KM90]|uniref:hypothetical protein n=1 Tax=Nonomuraea sp. KM90 TaxID=3457428 RepID=UPI003FCCA920